MKRKIALALICATTILAGGFNFNLQNTFALESQSAKDELLVIPYQQYDLGAGNFSEGLAFVINGEGKVGYIDKTGKLVIPYQYGTVEGDAADFSEGLAWVSNGDGKIGYIDKTGKLVIPYQYSRAGDFSEGLARVENYVDGEMKIGFIRKPDDNYTALAQPQKQQTPVNNNSKTGDIKYRVQKWDTLGQISLRNYGSYAYHKDLYRINKAAFAKTKGKLVPGMEIILPQTIGKAKRLAPLDTTKGKIHTVKAGETLGIIANMYYKTPNKYNVIFEANRDRIKKANMIYEGQQILIPNIKK